MTLDELKAEAAKLSPEQRMELAFALQTDREVEKARFEWLKKEIMIGVEDIRRGDFTECKDEAELKAFFEGIKARGRERLAARRQQAA